MGRWRSGKRADYLLRCGPDFPIAEVEGKLACATPGDEIQWVKNRAVMPGIESTYVTHGHGTGEIECSTGLERESRTPALSSCHRQQFCVNKVNQVAEMPVLAAFLSMCGSVVETVRTRFNSAGDCQTRPRRHENVENP